MKEQTRSVRRTLEPAPQLRIMGEIEVMGTQRPLSDQQVALVAFLQCCGPVGRSSVVQAVWAGERISSQRVANLLAEVRSIPLMVATGLLASRRTSTGSKTACGGSPRSHNRLARQAWLDCGTHTA
jgi:hypothetical protein